MELKAYTPEDLEAILALFYHTVHAVNARHYAPEQIEAWADGRPDARRWDASLRAHHSLVAWLEGKIVGFGDMDETGYLDRLYVHPDHHRHRPLRRPGGGVPRPRLSDPRLHHRPPLF